MQHVLRMALEKETKGTFRYKEVPPEGEAAVIGTLYIRKHGLSNPPPDTIKVTIELDD